MTKRFPALLFSFALVAAACGGTSEEAAEPVEETTTTTEAPVETTTEAPPETEPAGPVDGQVVYEENCSRCHGDDGSGGRGSNLQGISVDQPETADAIEQVNLGGGGMPAFGNTLSAEEIEASIDYIWATF